MRKNILVVAAAALLAAYFCPSGCPSGALGPRPACAQDDDPEVTRMAKEHFKLGLDAYNAGKYDLAIKELKKAYLLKRLPPILLNIGLTYRKTKDYDMAIYFYKKFLNEAPPEDKQRGSAEDSIKEIEAEKAAAAAPPPSAPARPAVEAAPRKEAKQPAVAVAPPSPSSRPPTEAGLAPGAERGTPTGAGAGAAEAPVSEWSHTTLDAVPPGQPVDVRVQMPVMKGVKVKVYFRKEGQADWSQLELKRRGNEKVARLPPEVTTGSKTFQYYVEAKDAAGTMVKSSGSEASPNIVLVDPTARPQFGGAEASGTEEEEGPKARKGFSRDIENEGARFDPEKEKQRAAMEKLHGQIGRESTPRKQTFTGLGYAGIAVAAVGLLAIGGGAAMFALAGNDASIVSQDSMCGTGHTVKAPDGSTQCPHFGPNPDPSMTRSLPLPTSADYFAEGSRYNTAGNALIIAGPILAVGGVAMITADILKRKVAERAEYERTHPKPKKKVRRIVIEEEADNSQLQLNLHPVFGRDVVGAVGELRF